ncbi:biotin/lipoyl-binding protein [Siccirubricoccus sp. G192]|uniref:biotin/lipoyl-binding protein n=1 Tax=Siccirubricoccus sp. G192 TaxID=2849651 RepID=UPI002810FD64|nr:biotin/lipoyl-binding protein [Siccirubricoccus sp. G192]
MREASRAGMARQRLRLGAILVVLLAALAGAGLFIHRLITHVFVDDARIAADMITFASRVPGWVTEVRVIAGDQLAAGEVMVRIDSRDSALAARELEARQASLAARRRELEARLAMVDLQTTSQQAASRARLEVARAALPAAEAERLFAEGDSAAPSSSWPAAAAPASATTRPAARSTPRARRCWAPWPRSRMPRRRSPPPPPGARS